MPTNINVYRDQRTQNDAMVFALNLTREVFHDVERQVVFSAARIDNNFTHTIGNRLRELGYDGPAWAAWMDLRDQGLSGGMDGGRFDMHNPKHQVGLMLAALPEQSSEMHRSLAMLDHRCRVSYQSAYNQLDMTITLYAEVQVPMSLSYQMQNARMGGSSLEISRRQEFMDFEAGGGMQARLRGSSSTGISLGGVEIGEFRDTQINVEESSLSAPERENIRQEAEALSKQQRKQQLERQQAILRADEALKKPQGTLAPRKTKRVSVATGTPALEAESPRRMKIRRDREN